MTKYISATETAKIVRKILKENFNGIKFSVRSETYSMGSAVNVSWTDGPTQQEVDDVVGYLCGSGFDSMNDMKYTIHHWILPDGRIVIAPRDKLCPYDATEVVFADHISTTRKYSNELMSKIVNYINKKFGVDNSVRIIEFDNGRCGMETLNYDNRSVFWRIQKNAKLVNGKLAINCSEMTSKELYEVIGVE